MIDIGKREVHVNIAHVCPSGRCNHEGKPLRNIWAEWFSERWNGNFDEKNKPECEKSTTKLNDVVDCFNFMDSRSQRDFFKARFKLPSNIVGDGKV